MVSTLAEQVSVLPCNCPINKQGVYCEESRDECETPGFCYPDVTCDVDSDGIPSCGECPLHYEQFLIYDDQLSCRGN